MSSLEWRYVAGDATEVNGFCGAVGDAPDFRFIPGSRYGMTGWSFNGIQTSAFWVFGGLGHTNGSGMMKFQFK